MKAIQVIRLIFFPVLLFSSALFAQTPQQATSQQEEPFKASWVFNNLKPSFTLNQIYQNNWLKGGEDALTYNIILDNDFERKGKRSDWGNEILLKFGQSKIGKGERNNTPNSINIRTDLKLNFDKQRYFKPFIGGSLKTQIATGYKFSKDKPREAQSDFWDPVKIAYRFGVDLSLVKDLKIQISTDYIIEKGNKYVQIHNIDNKKTPDIIEKRKITKKMSVYVKFNRRFTIKDRTISINSKINIKSAFKNFEETFIDWTNIYDINLIEFVSLRIDMHYIYNRSKSKQGQFQYLLGITFAYDLKDIFSKDEK